MKFVCKFKLELPLGWQGLVAPCHGILIGLIPSSFFHMDKVEALIMLVVISSS
jgi:hypothetical protein